MPVDINNIPPECLEGKILGCTYAGALNYDPSANFDDGSCIFPTPTSFDVNIFGTHYQECTNGAMESRAGFFIHIPQITPSSPVSSFEMFVRFYAFPWRNNHSEVQISCIPAGTDLLATPLSVGSDDRLLNNRLQVLHVDNITPNLVMMHGADELNSDIDFPNEQLPCQIIIIADNLMYSTTDIIQIYPYAGSFTPASEIITVT